MLDRRCFFEAFSGLNYDQKRYFGGFGVTKITFFFVKKIIRGISPNWHQVVEKKKAPADRENSLAGARFRIPSFCLSADASSLEKYTEPRIIYFPALGHAFQKKLMR